MGGSRRPVAVVAGFTLIELIVALSIAAILATVAVPSFRSLVLDSRRATFVNDLIAAMQYARSESMVRGAVVAACPSGNGTSCASEASGWSSGWIVFLNSDADSPPVVDSGEAILKTGRAQSADMLVRATPVAYNFRPFNKASSNGTLVICDSRGSAHARAIIVSPTGRVRSSVTNAEAGALTCP